MRVRRSSAKVNVDGKALNLHYWLAGSGPPLFLLHPSPLSGAFMQPLLKRLAHRVTAIAPDTPGFGESDPIPGAPVDLRPFVQAMKALRKALGLRQVAVYGSATGAQIAIEWAKADAPAVSGLVLDNAADFTDAERRRIMDGYFPDVAPVADGRHLARAWRTAHDATLFFPWQRPEDGRRIAPRLGPAAAMDLTARGYLAAGPGYRFVYEAAFRNERAERVQPIRTPLVIMRWQGSILKPWTDRFDAYTWNDNVVMAHCGPKPEQRWRCLEAHLPAVLAKERTSARALLLDTGAIRYVDIEPADGQICYRLPQSGPPKGIVLHELGGASNLVAPEQNGVPFVRMDLPGHGGSDAPQDLSLAHCVQAVSSVATALDASELTVCGQGAAQRIAQLAAAQNAKLRFMPMSTPCPQEAPPSLAAETSGAHLWRGWHWLRGQHLERGEAPPAPERLTQMLLALLQSEDAFRTLHKAI